MEGKVLVVIGTRPEAIKMAPVIRELGDRALVCVTGQHREMVDQALQVFGIVPDYDFGIMQENQGLNDVAARVMVEMDRLLRDLSLPSKNDGTTPSPFPRKGRGLRPEGKGGVEWVLVQGDTTTAMAAAIAAANRRVKVGHVEAGLRTRDRGNPFPEEMNRVVIDHVADALFAPTMRARQNLFGEGISYKQIHLTGNTGIDALMWITETG